MNEYRNMNFVRTDSFDRVLERIREKDHKVAYRIEQAIEELKWDLMLNIPTFKARTSLRMKKVEETYGKNMYSIRVSKKIRLLFQLKKNNVTWITPYYGHYDD